MENKMAILRKQVKYCKFMTGRTIKVVGMENDRRKMDKGKKVEKGTKVDQRAMMQEEEKDRVLEGKLSLGFARKSG